LKTSITEAEGEQMTSLAARLQERDLVEHYFEQPWSDGFPVVPPTAQRVAAVLDALGGNRTELNARIPPRWGSLTTELLAVNMVMAGCKPDYAPVVRAAVPALADGRFNRLQDRDEFGDNVFGSGNRASATIGRAVRLILLAVAGGIPGALDKSTLGRPGKYTLHVAENEEAGPRAPTVSVTATPPKTARCW
jgi:hypothetical protein